MPKIRIHDPASGFKLWLPIPYKLFINLFLRRTVVLKILQDHIRGIKDDLALDLNGGGEPRKILEQRLHQLEILVSIAEEFDYGELRCALTDTAQYRGLVLVDVQGADGTLVHITL